MSVAPQQDLACCLQHVLTAATLDEARVSFPTKHPTNVLVVL